MKNSEKNQNNLYSVFVSGPNGYIINVVSASQNSVDHIPFHRKFHHCITLCDGTLLIISDRVFHADGVSLGNKDDHSGIFFYAVDNKKEEKETCIKNISTSTSYCVDSKVPIFCQNCSTCQMEYHISFQNIDLSDLNNGDLICGDLRKFGWAVVKCPSLTRGSLWTPSAMDRLLNRIKEHDKLKSVGASNDSSQPPRQMLWYNPCAQSSLADEDWGIILTLLEQKIQPVVTSFLGKKVNEFSFSHQNLFRNNCALVQPQQYHRNYYRPNLQSKIPEKIYLSNPNNTAFPPDIPHDNCEYYLYLEIYFWYHIVSYIYLK